MTLFHRPASMEMRSLSYRRARLCGDVSASGPRRASGLSGCGTRRQLDPAPQLQATRSRLVHGIDAVVRDGVVAKRAVISSATSAPRVWESGNASSSSSSDTTSVKADRRGGRTACRAARPGGFEPPTVGLEVRCSIQTELRALASRGARIRTGDLLHPKQARYHAALHPVAPLGYHTDEGDQGPCRVERTTRTRAGVITSAAAPFEYVETSSKVEGE